MRWEWRRFDELTPSTLYAVLQLRQRVFVVEQACPYLDADGRDARAWHLLGWLDSDDAAEQLAAYARIFAPGELYDEASIGRIVTAPELRRGGHGRALVDEALRRCRAMAHGSPVRIAAQRYLEPFYASFGFRRAGEDFDEDGIPHVEMVREPAQSAERRAQSS